jgi:alkanesulfonate monooxygenase SsuD/methylene tetrahydromethanopterin reductase-like flavin-dependent oxidoreductase (luciferase family)
MARIARPILLYCPTIHGVKHSLDIYRDAMFSAGFDEPAVEEALSRSWVWRDTYVAETDDRAMDEYLPAFDRAVARMNDLREQWNPKDMDIPKRPAPLPRSNYEWSPLPNTDELMVGSPRRVAEHVALLRDAGARNLIMTHRNLLPREESTNHIRLFSDKIMPLFRDR